MIPLRFAPAVLVALCLLAANPAWSLQPLEYVAAGDYDAARAELMSRVGTGKRAAFDVAYLESIIATHKGDTAKAERILREILSLAPDFAPASHDLSIILARRGERDAAMFHAERFVSNTTDDTERERVQRAILQDGGGKKGGFAPRFSIVPSSNANRGTRESIVLVGGVPFVLNEASRAQNAVGLSFGVTG